MKNHYKEGLKNYWDNDKFNVLPTLLKSCKSKTSIKDFGQYQYKTKTLK